MRSLIQNLFTEPLIAICLLLLSWFILQGVLLLKPGVVALFVIAVLAYFTGGVVTEAWGGGRGEH